MGHTLAEVSPIEIEGQQPCPGLFQGNTRALNFSEKTKVEVKSTPKRPHNIFVIPSQHPLALLYSFHCAGQSENPELGAGPPEYRRSLDVLILPSNL
jgi:hypothetical protein